MPSIENDINSLYYLEVKELIEDVLVKTAVGFTIFDEFEMYEDGILEVTCQVVDLIVAKELIERTLKNSKFSNYKKIYEDDFR